MKTPPQNYLVVGAGKTGVDAVLHLMDHGVSLERVHWIVPNDAWFFDRWEPDDDLFSFFSNYFDSLLHDEDDTWQKILLR